MKPAHRRWPYDRHAAIIRAAANANPDTRCWRCGQEATLASTLCLIAAILAGIIAAGRLIRGGIEGALIPGAICLIAAALALTL